MKIGPVPHVRIETGSALKTRRKEALLPKKIPHPNLSFQDACHLQVGTALILKMPHQPKPGIDPKDPREPAEPAKIGGGFSFIALLFPDIGNTAPKADLDPVLLEKKVVGTKGQFLVIRFFESSVEGIKGKMIFNKSHFDIVMKPPVILFGPGIVYDPKGFVGIYGHSRIELTITADAAEKEA